MKYKKSVFRNLSLITQLGLCVVTPMFLCIFAGSYLDARFGTKTVLPLLVLGILAGGRSAYVLARRMITAEQKEDEKDLSRQAEEALLHGISKPKQPSRIRTTQKDAEYQEGTKDVKDISDMGGGENEDEQES